MKIKEELWTMVKYPPPPLNFRGLNIAIDIDHYPVIHRQLNVNITLVEISHVNFRFRAQKQPSS